MGRPRLSGRFGSLRGVGAVVAAGVLLSTAAVAGPASAVARVPVDDTDSVVHPQEWQVHPAQGSLYEGWTGYEAVGLGLWTNGDATGVLTTTEPSTRLVVEAASDRCPQHSGPRMLLWVDDVLVGDEVVDADKGRYVVPGSWAAGTHTVRVQFTNDSRSPTCDVNLKLARAWLDDETLMERFLLGSAFTLSPATAGHATWPPPPNNWPSHLLWSNGSLTTTVTTPFTEGAYLEVQAASDPCDGLARFELLVDGVSVAHAEAPAVVDQRRRLHTLRIHLPVELSAGPTEITVRYVNDHVNRQPLQWCDRNLRVGAVRVVATL